MALVLVLPIVIVVVQLSSVAQLCLTLRDPMDCSTPGFPVHCQLPEPIQNHVHHIIDAIQPSHPLSSPSPPAFNLSQHQGLFKCSWRMRCGWRVRYSSVSEISPTVLLSRTSYYFSLHLLKRFLTYSYNLEVSILTYMVLTKRNVNFLFEIQEISFWNIENSFKNRVPLKGNCCYFEMTSRIEWAT